MKKLKPKNRVPVKGRLCPVTYVTVFMLFTNKLYRRRFPLCPHLKQYHVLIGTPPVPNYKQRND